MTYIIIGCLLLAVFIYEKFSFLKKRSESKKMVGEVIRYKFEKGPIRNDYTNLYYPYVRITLDSGVTADRKLRHADNIKKHFEIGEQLEVFLLDDELLLWNAVDVGLWRLIPPYQ